MLEAGIVDPTKSEWIGFQARAGDPAEDTALGRPLV